MVSTDVRDVNYQKFLMPSVANIIGVDLSAYKLVYPNQFACNLMHVGRDECLPVAMHNEDAPVIVSPAYFTFEVKDTTRIIPDYLSLWLKRPEFDREATFYTDADVRQGLIKSAFLDIQIKVPLIEEQQKIVAEYKTIERRIENNRRLISTLEATAQSIYRHLFVDNIDPENLPTGWKMASLTSIASYFNGAACQKFSDYESDSIPVLKIKELGQGFSDVSSDRVNPNVPPQYIINNDDIVFSWSATLLIDYWEGGTIALNQHLFKVTPINVPDWFAYFATLSNIERWVREISAKAVSMSHIKRDDLETSFVSLPNDEILEVADSQIKPIVTLIKLLKREQNLLNPMLCILLSKLSK